MSAKNGNWFGRHKVLSVILGLIILIVIGSAIGSSGNSGLNNKPTNDSSTSSGNNSAKSSAKTPAVAHVGSTVAIGGSKGLGVTLQKVIDPATGSDEFNTPDAGKRFVALQFQIVNNGSASFSDDANNDATLIGSDNQSYTADFDTVSECTNFSNGQFTLGASESSTGCVVFQVPNGVTTAKVQFQTESGFSQSTGEWLVP